MPNLTQAQQTHVVTTYIYTTISVSGMGSKSPEVNNPETLRASYSYTLNLETVKWGLRDFWPQFKAQPNDHPP